jgi:hypothetical protein
VIFCWSIGWEVMGIYLRYAMFGDMDENDEQYLRHLGAAMNWQALNRFSLILEAEMME